MNCRSATQLLRRGPALVTGTELDAAAGHIVACLLCQEELLGLLPDRPGRSSLVAQRLEALVSECRAVQPELAAIATAVAQGSAAAARFPEVAAHLDVCPSCSLDYKTLVDLGRPWAHATNTDRVTFVSGLRAVIGAVGARFRDVPPALLPDLALVGRRMGAPIEPSGEQFTVRPPGADLVITVRIDPAREGRIGLNVTVGPETVTPIEIGLYVIGEGGRGARQVVPGRSLARDLPAGSYELQIHAPGRTISDVVIPFEFATEGTA